MKKSEVKNILLKKSKFVIIISLLCALCAASYKYVFTPVEIIQGDFIYSRIIRIESEKDNIASKTQLNYSSIINTNRSYQKFIENTDNKIFFYSKINSSWNRLIQQNKISWLQQRIWLKDHNNGIFEIGFVVPTSNISDLTYLVNNTTVLMDAFILNAQDSIREIDSGITIKKISDSEIIPQVIKVDKRIIAVKNAVYGLIAGLFFSIVALIGVPFFEEC